MSKNAMVDKMRRERSQKSKLCTILRNEKEEVTRESQMGKKTTERN